MPRSVPSGRRFRASGMPMMTKLLLKSPCTITPQRPSPGFAARTSSRQTENTARMPHTPKMMSRGFTALERSEE